MLSPVPLLFLLAASGPAPSCCDDDGPASVLFAAATCTGASPCRACKNCSSCAHCKGGGGSCGVCSSAPSPAPSAMPPPPARRPSTRRRPPAPEPSYATLSEEERKRLYGEYHNAGLLASWEADAKYPLGRLPADQAETARCLRQRKALYEARKTTARAVLAKKFRVTTETVLKVEKEGDEAHWPLPTEPDNPFKPRPEGPR